MSSPRPPRASTRSAAPAASKSTPKARKPASDEGMSKQDKANFVKAMMEGLPPRDGKTAAKTAEAPRPHVEVLRKISAPEPPRPANAESKQALDFAAMIERKVSAGEIDVLTPEATQALVAALCKLYGAHAEAGTKFPVLGGRAAVTGTDAMIMCAALLKAVDLQVFELGMWQSWAGV